MRLVKFKIEVTLPGQSRVFEGMGEVGDGKELPLFEVVMGILKGVQDKESLQTATGLEIAAFHLNMSVPSGHSTRKHS